MLIKNAILSIKKNIGKSLLLLIIMIVIANLVLASLAIKKATNSSMTSLRESMGSSVSLTYNMQKIMENREKGTSMENLIQSINVSDADKLKSLKYVSSYNYNVNVNVNSSTINPIETTNNDDSNRPKMEDSSSFSVSGNTSMSNLSVFTNENYVLKSGRLLTSQDANSNNVVISSTLADDNNLKVGSTFSVSTDNATVTLTVVGIYTIKQTSMDMGDMSNRSNPYNTLYTSLETAQNLNGSTTTLSNATYYLNDPKNVDSFISLAKKTSIDFDTYALNTGDRAYKQSLSSLENIDNFTTLFLIVTIVAGSVILSLILILSIRNRFYEFGVLLSLGLSKIKIISQQFIEIGLIAVIAIMLSFSTGSFISNKISNMITTTNTTEMSPPQNENSTSNSNSSKNEVTGENKSQNTNLNISITPTVAMQLTLVTTAICMISVCIPAIYISRLSPREILTKKEG